MNQSKNNHNEEWRKIFSKAVEVPPPDIWENIEKRLDQHSEKPPVAPWWKKNWLAAASVLLALSVGGVFFVLNNPETGSSEVAVGEVENQSVLENRPELGSGTLESIASDSSVTAGQEHLDQTFTKTQQTESLPEKVNYSETTAAAPVIYSADGVKSDASPLPVSLTEKQLPAGGTRTSSENRIEKNVFLADLVPIEPADFREIKTYWQTRYVFFNPYADQSIEENVSKPETAPLWAGLSMMPGGFNPNMEFTHQSVYQMNNAMNDSYHTAGFFGQTNRGTTDNRDQAKVSYQAAAHVGVSLSKNWTVESGISYLQGNSTSRSPGFYLNKMTQESADLLPNALVSGNANYSQETIQNLQLARSSDGYSTVYVPMDKNMSNKFQYVQVPVYAGYTFRPEKKFSYTMLAGGVTNFFLKNNLETVSGYVLETKPKNNVYNNLSLSAAAGVRVNYRLNETWHTNLTANYQQALMNSFKDNPFLKSRPQVYGISWGVRYTFQN